MKSVRVNTVAAIFSAILISIEAVLFWAFGFDFDHRGAALGWFALVAIWTAVLVFGGCWEAVKELPKDAA
jgi:hypothetical protein